MGKGRDKNLIKERDKALCKRYYYWSEVQRLRFDDCLTILSEQEFFISKERILKIIRQFDNIAEVVQMPEQRNKIPRLTTKHLVLFKDKTELPK